MGSEGGGLDLNLGNPTPSLPKLSENPRNE